MEGTVTIWHLELSDPEQFTAAGPSALPYELIRSEIPQPELNRFLYASVGADWTWYMRLNWTYAQWLEDLSRPQVSTWIAYVRGTPAGYFELEEQAEAAVEIRYFGLLPRFIGRGMGGALLSDAVRTAWSLGGKRVWLHTCSLDHPAALGNYQARGFRLFDTQQHREQLPDHPLEPWPGAYPRRKLTPVSR
ncbi:MAG: GNAT family N-acetyltransferase [Pseudomonadales bacterium]|nr:GNAT family N-acetyltransferase [Pseudomonadales bacterium]